MVADNLSDVQTAFLCQGHCILVKIVMHSGNMKVSNTYQQHHSVSCLENQESFVRIQRFQCRALKVLLVQTAQLLTFTLSLQNIMIA